MRVHSHDSRKQSEASVHFRKTANGRQNSVQPLNVGHGPESGEFTFKVRGSGSRFFIKTKRTLEGIDEHNYYQDCLIPNKYREQTLQEARDNWLTENTLDMYNELFLKYCQMSDHNEEWKHTCLNDESLGFPKGMIFKWKDPNERGARKQNVNAMEYVEKVFVWIANLADNPNIFPPEEKDPFPENLMSILRTIFKRMFRVYAIIYSNKCLLKDPEDENVCHLFKSFLYFGIYWNLLRTDDYRKMVPQVVDPILYEYSYDKDMNEKNEPQEDTLREDSMLE